MDCASRTAASRLMLNVEEQLRAGNPKGWVVVSVAEVTLRRCLPDPPRLGVLEVAFVVADFEAASKGEVAVVAAFEAAAAVASGVVVTSALAPTEVTELTEGMAQQEGRLLALGMSDGMATGAFRVGMTPVEVVAPTMTAEMAATEMVAVMESGKDAAQEATWSRSGGEKVGIVTGTMTGHVRMIIANEGTKVAVMKIPESCVATDQSSILALVGQVSHFVSRFLCTPPG